MGKSKLKWLIFFVLLLLPVYVFGRVKFQDQITSRTDLSSRLIQVDSATALMVNKANGDNVFIVDTTNASIIFSQIDNAATPVLAFGDGDTGFYEEGDDSLGISFAGVKKYLIQTSRMGSDITDGAIILSANPTATAPAFTFNSDQNTGIGYAGADQLSLIAGGVEGIRVTTATTTILGNLGVGTSTPANTDLQVWSSASSTIQIGDATHSGCIVMGDSDNAGLTYVTALNGVLTATTTKPSVCQ